MADLRRFSVQFRAAPAEEDGAPAPEGVLVGYASVYDVEYRIGPGLNESIAPGAFSESLKRQDGMIPAFYQHDWNDPIGVIQASEDEHGLKVEASLFVDANPKARSVWLAAQAGALREWSIGFFPETITLSEDGGLEIVERGELVEASVVVRGANPATEMVEVRAEPDPEPEEPAWIVDHLGKQWVRDLLRESL